MTKKLTCAWCGKEIKDKESQVIIDDVFDKRHYFHAYKCIAEYKRFLRDRV